MRKTIPFLVVFWVGLWASIIAAETYWAGELPSISDTKLKAEVVLTDDIYVFNYTIISGNTNTGQIWSFDIDIKKPEGGIDVKGEELVNGPGYLKNTSAQVLSESATPKMVPVGLLSPVNWNSGPDILGQVGWGANDDPYMILKGQSLSGFQISSRGLPGLRNFIIEPVLVPPSEESDVTIEQIKQVEDRVSFKGKTLGPTAPPAQFGALDFLDYLIDLKHQAAQLGWITDIGVAHSLDVKLDEAKKKLQAGDTNTASNILSAFVNEVKAQGCPTYTACPKGKHLLPEAWALLKFNAEFLRAKL